MRARKNKLLIALAVALLATGMAVASDKADEQELMPLLMGS